MNKEENYEIDYFDYFHTKYCSDISDLFLEIKEITEGFCLQIFNDSKNDSYDLTEFLFENIILKDEIENEEEEILNENIEEENIV